MPLSGVEHGVFGYTCPPEGLIEEVVSLLERAHSWKVDPLWIVWLPGLVTGINVACRAVGEEGDAVMTTVPAYPPFLSAPVLSGRRLITVPLAVEGGRYVFNFEGIGKAETERTRMFLLCNPQNPTGRVFTRGELERRSVCLERGRHLLGRDPLRARLDEDARHISVPPSTEIARHTITLLALNKTWPPGWAAPLPSYPIRAESRFTKVMTASFT